MVTIGSQPGPRDFVGQMLALEREIRGGILDSAIRVERALDLIIANHFCQPDGEKWHQLYSLVLASGSLTFQRKEEIVLGLLRNWHPEVLGKYPTIKSDLKQVRENRNTIAHSEVGMSGGFASGSPPDHINLVLYRSGTRKFRKLTREDAAKMETQAMKVFRALAKLADAVAQTWGGLH